MNNTITTYETHKSAFNVLQYGFKPNYSAYRIKGYSMRKIEDISTSSLRRIERLLEKQYRHLSDTSEHWFRTVFYVHPVCLPYGAITGLIQAKRIRLNTRTQETISGNIPITSDNEYYVNQLLAYGLVYTHDNHFSLTERGIDYTNWLIDNDPQIAKFYYRR